MRCIKSQNQSAVNAMTRDNTKVVGNGEYDSRGLNTNWSALILNIQANNCMFLYQIYNWMEWFEMNIFIYLFVYHLQ